MTAGPLFASYALLSVAVNVTVPALSSKVPLLGVMLRVGSVWVCATPPETRSVAARAAKPTTPTARRRARDAE